MSSNFQSLVEVRYDLQKNVLLTVKYFRTQLSCPLLGFHIHIISLLEQNVCFVAEFAQVQVTKTLFFD